MIAGASPRAFRAKSLSNPGQPDGGPIATPAPSRHPDAIVDRALDSPYCQRIRLDAAVLADLPAALWVMLPDEVGMGEVGGGGPHGRPPSLTTAAH